MHALSIHMSLSSEPKLNQNSFIFLFSRLQSFFKAICYSEASCSSNVLVLQIILFLNLKNYKIVPKHIKINILLKYIYQMLAINLI